MRKIFYILIAVVLVASVYLTFREAPIEVEKAQLQKAEFVESFSSEGKIQSRDRETVFAFASGHIEKLPIKVGDVVKKDVALAKLTWEKTTVVKSSLSGVVTKLFRDSAGPVTRGDPLFEVASLDKLEVVTEVLTPDALRLKTGGKAEVINWGGEGVLAAEIVNISRAGAVKTSSLGVDEERTEVRLKLLKLPEGLGARLGDNYHVDVVFEVSRTPSALVVPLGAIFKSPETAADPNSELWSVYVIENSRAQQRPILIGPRNSQVAIVNSGLRPGETVILFPSDKIHSNALVK